MEGGEQVSGIPLRRFGVFLLVSLIIQEDFPDANLDSGFLDLDYNG